MYCAEACQSITTECVCPNTGYAGTMYSICLNSSGQEMSKSNTGESCLCDCTDNDSGWSAWVETSNCYYERSRSCNSTSKYNNYESDSKSGSEGSCVCPGGYYNRYDCHGNFEGTGTCQCSCCDDESTWEDNYQWDSVSMSYKESISEIPEKTICIGKGTRRGKSRKVCKYTGDTNYSTCWKSSSWDLTCTCICIANDGNCNNTSDCTCTCDTPD